LQSSPPDTSDAYPSPSSSFWFARRTTVNATVDTRPTLNVPSPSSLRSGGMLGLMHFSSAKPTA
jgi:hypothetical protein